MSQSASDINPTADPWNDAKKAEHEGRVLLVDDEPSILKAYGRLLSRAGFSVTTAPCAQDALALVRDRRFDVVVSDRRMPEMDGVALLRSLRETDEDLPFVLLTGSPDFGSAAETVELGALRYLTKPARPQELIQAATAGVRAHREAERRREALSLLERAATTTRERQALDRALSEALDRITMAYQPIWRAEGGRLQAVEALVRSSHTSLTNPGLLIEAAEELGRVHDLGRAVRSRVVQDISTLPPDIDVFVNVHPLELDDEQLYAPEAPLTAHARRVVLEITERAALVDNPALQTRLQELRRLGFRLAVDDIGAGYASLSALVVLHPDVVKIDMSLVRDVHRDPIKCRVIRAIGAVAHALSMTVVAEGIEVAEELGVVMGAGCQLLQGYLLGRPAAVDHPQIRGREATVIDLIAPFKNAA